ncbi:hypothetical protein ACFQ4K_15905 [Tistrella bauzanensis]
MSGFEFNKLMAAFLTAALFAMVVGVVSEMVYEPEHLEQNAYVIEGVEQSGAAEAPAEIPGGAGIRRPQGRRQGLRALHRLS